MKNLESFVITYKGKSYNNIIAQKIGKFLFYKSKKKHHPSFIFDKVKLTRKIQ